MAKQPWIYSSKADLLFILFPPFAALLAVILFPSVFQQFGSIPLLYWVLLIMFIDVAHVYTTLYQTYFNPQRLKKHYSLYMAIPVICYVAGVILHSIDGMLFWRILAYLAVFHFIRQQYGFMRLYSRNETQPEWFRLIDTISVYTATIYPILFWHFSGDRNFNWFVDGEFFSFQSEGLLKLSTLVYLLIIGTYIIKEAVVIIKNKQLNIPRNLLIAGTFLSWYFGIIYFNGDMAFTTLNVVSHGIPYMALVWFMQKKEQPQYKSPLLQQLKRSYGIVIFLGIIVLLAYFEEGLWDGFIWKEHQSFFSLFQQLPVITNKETLALIVPLLSLPQSTHYVLDGFIWKKGHA